MTQTPLVKPVAVLDTRPDDPSRLPLYIQLKMVLRSFLVQAMWNYEKMQALGLAYMMLPAFRYYEPDRLKRMAMLSNELRFFNTHPYLSPLVGGLTVRRLFRANSELLGVYSPRARWMGSLGAIGDSLIWSGVRVIVVLVSGVLILLTPLISLLMLVLYNAGQFVLRGYALHVSQMGDSAVFERISKLRPSSTRYWFGATISVLLGAILVVLLRQVADRLDLRPDAWLGAVGLLGAYLLVAFGRQRYRWVFLFTLTGLWTLCQHLL